jgi:hypothetical protein
MAKVQQDRPAPVVRLDSLPRRFSPVADCKNRTNHGAGDEIRTHDPNLGKVVLYP